MLFDTLAKRKPVSPAPELAAGVREYVEKSLEALSRAKEQRQKKVSLQSVSDAASVCYSAAPVEHKAVELPDAVQKQYSIASRPAKRELLSEDFLAERSHFLEEIMKRRGETFQARLLRMIDERGLTDVQAYKRAGKDKKLFHKIRSNPQYQPSKHTVFAFALGLQLSLDEAKDLLASAGFAFSPGNRFDLIIKYMLENEIYDLYTVDCILYELGEEEYFCCEK